MDWTVVGHQYRDFIVKKSLWIEELKCRLIELEHAPTGAQVMQIANDDPENLFCLSFQTVPTSSDGVAHILEHTVLCGSKKYPLKDPFFAMTRRSLNTFMNALTGSDFTCYPAASQVKKDFYNLLDVYLDAVFYPNLKEISFSQEGHRFEFEEGKLQYKGVVFNEMKGAMASQTSRLYDHLYRALFPDITYGWNSGGDPLVIPELTYQQLLDFHQKYYHPSRCLFFFYGNLPLEEHLDYITDRVLAETKKLPPLEKIPKQKRFTEMKRLTGSYPATEDEDAMDCISFAWLTCSVLDQEELLALTILEAVLMDTDASPLKKAFLRSGLCTQAQAFMDPDITEIPFVITLRGCKSDDADALEELLSATLQEIASEGIPEELIDNVMHQIEFHRSEITGDQSPFGLTLFMRSALLKQHGAVAEESLMIHSLFDRLRQKMKDRPDYFAELIKHWLLENDHFVRLVLKPDTELGNREREIEQKRLAEREAALTKDEKAAIIKGAEELEQYQIEQEQADQEILPRVALSDVPKATVDYSLKQEQTGPLTTYFHDTFTNKIVYADLSWKMPQVADEQLWLVRLFATTLVQVGAGGRNYSDTLNAVQADTGGIGAGMNLYLNVADRQKTTPTFHLSGKALYRKGEKFFDLMRDFAASADFSDAKRIEEIVMKHYTTLRSTFTQSAMKYALSLSASGLSASSKINNDLYGIDYYLKIKDLAEFYEQQSGWLIEQFKLLQQQLLQLSEPHLVVTCDADYFQQLSKDHFYGIAGLEQKSFVPWSDHFALPRIPSQGRPIASPVAFTSSALPTVPYTHPDAAALAAAAHLFDNTSLHVALREQGGAYGGGAICNSLSGQLLFYAYRDPNIVSTLKAFSTAAKKIAAGDFSDSDLEEAKLEKIQSLDSPISPGSRGAVAYGWLQEGRETSIRQQYRDRLLSLTKEQVSEAVKVHLLDQLPDATTVVFAGRELLERENQELKLTIV